MKSPYQLDYTPHRHALWAVLVVALVLGVACILADAASLPVQAYLGATADEIREYSNANMLRNLLPVLPLLAACGWLIGFTMLKYLTARGGVLENGFFGAPYKRDIYGRLCPKPLG